MKNSSHKMASNINWPFLTGIHDIDREILLRTPDEQLFPTCIISKYTQELCNESFWRNKFIRKFGTDLDEYTDKRSAKSYQKLYKELMTKSNGELLEISTVRGYLPLIKSLVETSEETGLDINLGGNNLAFLWNAGKIGLDVVTYLLENCTNIDVGDY